MVWYDLASCFDGLWGSKTYLDLYNTGVQNNSLNLIKKINEKTSLAIKTPVGISNKSEIQNTILQGENFSSTLCTSTLDVMSRECPLNLYKYKNSVNIPQMGFLDDIMNVTYCGLHTQQMNDYTNEEIRKRKMHFSEDKCKRMHIGNKVKKCKDILIDSWKLECKEENFKLCQSDSYQGKKPIANITEHLYLGEIVSHNLSNNANLALKIAKCQGIKNDINFILNNIYYGDHFFDIVKLLRNSMYLSVLIGNCEIWPNVTKNNIKCLESCDSKLLSQIMGVSNKGSYVLMLLEGGLLPIRHIIIMRRLNYVHTLLNMENSSLAKQVFQEQLKNPNKNDFSIQIQQNLIEFDIKLTFEEIEKIS